MEEMWSLLVEHDYHLPAWKENCTQITFPLFHQVSPQEIPTSHCKLYHTVLFLYYTLTMRKLE